MILQVLLFGGTLCFTWWLLRLLYLATAKGYVMALSRPFVDTIETPQTRLENPQKFWANVIVALLLLPLALWGLYLFGSDLLETMTAGANVQ